MHRTCSLAALSLLATLAGAAQADAPFAVQLDDENVSRLQPKGPHAIVGIDDWVLSNGVVCAGVTDLGRPGRFSLHGGALVDLGFCGREDDQFVLIHPMLNLDRGISPPYDSLVAEATASDARIRANAAADGLRYERVFRLDRDEPRRLTMTTTVARTGAGAGLSAWGDLTMHPSGSLRPFLATVGAPERSAGFRHPGSDGESIQSRMAGITQGNLHVMVGEDTADAQIAYGVHLVEARLSRDGDSSKPRRLPFFAIVSDDFGMTNTLARPPLLGGGGAIGLLELAQVSFLNIRSGETLRLETRIYVSERADVASITDFVYPDAARVRGHVDDATARIHVDTADGHPLTEVRPDPSGAFAFRAPVGSYVLRAVAPGARTRELAVDVSDEDEDVDAGTLELGRSAEVELQDLGPRRLVFVGIDGTTDPELFDDLLGLQVGDRRPAPGMRSNSVSLAGLPSDPDRIRLPPGRYRVVATRGPEFGLAETTIELEAGEAVALPELVPLRAIETPGWIAADLHVHTGASFDSGLPPRERVRSFVAQGGEVLVATEHDRVFDLGPAIRELGLAESLASVVGVEATSVLQSEAAPFTFGHANVFPVPHRPERFRSGAPTSQGVRLRQMIAEVRAFPHEPLVQLNHPRSWSGERWDGSFFTHLSVEGKPFDPALPLDAAPNRALVERDPASGLRDLDFDAVELLNGSGAKSHLSYLAVRADWFALLRQGEIRTATANSDSHRLVSPVGVPRTYVPASDDRPSVFDQDAFVRALREGRVFGTTGPVIEVDLSGAGIGDRYTGSSATLTLGVRSADWARADRARAYVNGELVSEQPVGETGTVAWPLEFGADAFVTVEVEGDAGPGFGAVLAGSVPFAFSNPIFVDADGDGSWTPPGLSQ